MSSPVVPAIRLGVAALCLGLTLPTLVAATPGLRLDPLPQVVRELFHEPIEYAPLRPDQPLLRTRPSRQPMLEWATPFSGKNVSIDSAGVHYQPMRAGFPAGRHEFRRVTNGNSRLRACRTILI